MDDKPTFFKTPAGKSIIILITLAIGFFAGMEYKAYQIRSVINKTEKEIGALFTGGTTAASDEQVKKEPDEEKFIDKAVGDEVTLRTVKIQVNKFKEQEDISNSYGSMKVAATGAKFVVITMTVTNLTNSSISFGSEPFPLFDSQGRKFTTYSDTIGNIDNYLDVADFAPGIPKQGVYVYEVPLDSTGMYIGASKAGTDEAYHINLK